MDNVGSSFIKNLELETSVWGKLTRDHLLVISGYPTYISSFVDVVTGEQFLDRKLVIPVFLDKTDDIIKRFRNPDENFEVLKGYISYDTYAKRNDVRQFLIVSTLTYIVLFLLIIRNMFELQMSNATVVLNSIPDLVSLIKNSKSTLVSDIISEIENDDRYRSLINLVRGNLVFPMLYSQITELALSFSLYFLDYIGLGDVTTVNTPEVLKEENKS